jgi:hypothetical protein
MLHQNGNLVAVDTFKGSQEHQNLNLDNLYIQWKLNTEQARKKGQYVTAYKGTSYQMLGRLIAEQQEFDFIYIDGSHTAPDVITDAVMAWGMLRKNGIMLFDDYVWQDVPGILHRPKLGIDYFTTLFSEHSALVCMGHQLGLRKL